MWRYLRACAIALKVLPACARQVMVPALRVRTRVEDTDEFELPQLGAGWFRCFIDGSGWIGVD
jgi:hypothetical protein